MIEVGSLVKLVNMDYEYSTGFDKAWQNGLVGKVIKATKITNLPYGYTNTICTIKLITPLLSVKGNALTVLSGLDIRNLKQIYRTPIMKAKSDDRT